MVLSNTEALGRSATNLRYIVIGKCIIDMSFLMTFHVTLQAILCTKSLLTAITGTEEGLLPYKQGKTYITNLQTLYQTHTFKAPRRVIIFYTNKIV